MTHAHAPTDDPSRDELEHERAFLLASLADLERERDCGAIDDATFVRLSDDYTARAAAVIRALDAAPIDEPSVAPAAPRWRTALVVGAIVAFFAVSATVLWNALADRSATGTLTGQPVASTPPDQQRALLEADVARNPQSASAHRALARFFLQQQQYADALRAFDRATSLDPKDAESRAYAGWVTYLAGLSDRALVRLDDAIAADPQYPDAYFFRGVVRYRGLGRPDAAIPDLERYLALAPASPMAEQVQSVLSAARQAMVVAPSTVPPTNAPK